MIVVGSTFHRSAAWRCDSSPLNSCCQIWYFSSADSGRDRRLRDFPFCSDMVLLETAEPTRQRIVARQTTWREKPRDFGNEVRRKAAFAPGTAPAGMHVGFPRCACEVQ